MGTALPVGVQSPDKAAMNRFSTGWLRLGSTLLWLVGSLAWLSRDRLPRDGDEEGHVGAAELFRQQLQAGDWGAFAGDALWGSLGEYPPLLPALWGAWWWLTGVGQPGEAVVRALGLLSVPLTAWAVGRLAARSDRPGAQVGFTAEEAGRRWLDAETLAFCAVLLLPLQTGLSRHFMPEAALAPAVALALLAALRLAERPSAAGALLLGLLVGLGLMVKQTWLLVAPWPLLLALGRPRKEWAIAALGAGLVAGPWYLGQLEAQAAYGLASAGSSATPGLLGSLAYHPLVLAWAGWGPAMCLGVLMALPMVLRRPLRREVLVGLAWLLGGLLVLTLLPKKYPRLVVHLAPAGALLLGVGLARLPATGRRVLGGGVLAFGAAWLALASLRPIPPPDLVDALDPGCTQVWLRPAEPDDLGLSTVARAVAGARPGAVAVADPPEIPCAVQTTHPWLSHLGPYLRRAGVERELAEGVDPRAAVQIRFLDLTEELPPTGEALALPALDRWLVIEAR